MFEKRNLKSDILMVIVLSLIGFVFEDLWMLVRYSLIDNRNMFLPFLLGYGIFVVFIYDLIGTPKKLFHKFDSNKLLNVVIYFILCFILVSTGEIILGTLYEKIGHFSYWNYNHVKYHITKYTSIPTSLGFALVITLFMSFIYEPLYKLVKKISKKTSIIIIVIVLLALFIDLFISFRCMSINKGKNKVWEIRFNK